jgi:hypothetical protein
VAAARVQGDQRIAALVVPFERHADVVTLLPQQRGQAQRGVAVAVAHAGAGGRDDEKTRHGGHGW